MASEILVNQLTSFINQSQGMGPTDTTVQILNTTDWPVPGLFYRINIDNEILLVTANAGGLLTVTRGQESTAATGHAPGAVVITAVTAQAIYNSVGGGSGAAQCMSASNNTVINSGGGSVGVVFDGAGTSVGSNFTLDSSYSAYDGIQSAADTVTLINASLSMQGAGVPGSSMNILYNNAVYVSVPLVFDTSGASAAWSSIIELNPGDIVGVSVTEPSGVPSGSANSCQLSVVAVG